jgi:hypothetical protein
MEVQPMSEILYQPTPQTVAEQEAVLAQLLKEMQRLNEQMHRDQADIDRLKAETDLLRVETRAILARLGAVI